MLYWNLSFNAVAMFFLLLIFIWYFSEKRIPLRNHGVFLCLVLLVFVSTGLEITATFLGRNMQSSGYGAFYFVSTLQTLAVNIIPIVFAYYIVLIAGINIRKNKLLRVIFISCIAVDTIIIVLNPFLHWAFTFVKDRYYITSAGYVMHFIDAVMIFISILVITRKRKKFLFLKIMPLLFNSLFCLTAFIAQIFYWVPIFNCSLTAVLLTLFHYQQNAGTVTDITTGLFNRRFMGTYLKNRYMENKPFNLIVVAMDGFKFINKTYGVENGDALLNQVGRLLTGIKAEKTTFRLGSDQFCMVLAHDDKQLADVAEQIKNRFQYPWYGQNYVPIMLSASICCISCPEDASNYSELIEVIDYSMGIAKNTRRGMVTYANSINLDKIKQDKAIERAVKLAINNETLMVYYQPIFSVTKGVYNSAEALVRLNDTQLGWISPEDFIPIAEKNGLIVEMGEIILNKVCHFIHKFNLKETSIDYIEVNVSPIQLIQPDFAERVISILEEHHVSPNQINIEITETATVNSTQTVSSNIQKLVDYGITFSLDDYGSGNANISYINSMPFSIIKIDKFLIWDSFKNATAGITLEYTIGMLNALKLHIVAEGIETEEMKKQLSDFGCHYMQGWYYSKAVPDIEFIALLNKG